MKTYATTDPPYSILFLTMGNNEEPEEYINEALLAKCANLKRSDYASMDIVFLTDKILVNIWNVDNEIYANRDFFIEFTLESEKK